jgi:hypothetical protein
MASVLAVANTEVVKRFLILAGNMPQPRVGALFSEIGLIWNRNDWTEQTYALDLLENLAPYYATDVWELLKMESIGASLMELDRREPLKQAGQRWLKLIIALPLDSGADLWRELVQLFEHAGKARQSDVLRKLFIFAGNRAPFLPVEGIADFFAANLPHYLNRERGYFREELPRAFGKLWVAQWRIQRTGVDQILDQIGNQADKNEFLLRSMISGFALFLRNGTERDLRRFFQRLREMDDWDLRWKFNLIVIPYLLTPSLPEEVVEHPDLREMRDVVKEEITRSIRASMEDSALSKRLDDGKHREFFLMKEALKHAELGPQELVEVLGFDSLPGTSVWLDENRLGTFLVDAALAGHDAALEAMGQLVKDPTAVSGQLVGNVSSKLALIASPDIRVASWHVPIVLRAKRFDEAGALTRTLSLLIPETAGSAFGTYGDAALSFKNKLVGSQSERERRAGYELWYQLLRLRMVDPAEPEHLIQFVGKEQNDSAVAKVIRIFGANSGLELIELDKSIGFLLTICNSDHADIIIDNALASLTRLIVDCKTDSNLADKVLAAALRSPTSSKRLSLFGYVISSFEGTNIEFAASLLFRILKSEGFAELENQPQKNVANRLRSSVRSLFYKAPRALVMEAIKLVPSLPEISQRVLVEAMFHELHLEMKTELAGLPLESLHPKTRELIRRHREARKTDSSGWPELYQLLVAD